jgi:hypothetical protein
MNSKIVFCLVLACLVQINALSTAPSAALKANGTLDNAPATPSNGAGNSTAPAGGDADGATKKEEGDSAGDEGGNAAGGDQGGDAQAEE